MTKIVFGFHLLFIDEGKEMKSSVDEIRKRFDDDVDRFTDEKNGQIATVDAPIVLDMIAESVKALHTEGQTLLDIGCGGGNFTIRILQKIPGLHCTLLDLSRKMIERASQRVRAADGVVDRIIQEDVRSAILEQNYYDIIVSGAVLHHLRVRQEWKNVFQKIYNSLKPNGTYWYWDLIRHEIDEIEQVQQDRYKKYLIETGGVEFQKTVFDFIEKEDTPESSTFIISTLAEVGFKKIDILHKNVCYAAIMAKKE